jgi:hypothetical protein
MHEDASRECCFKGMLLQGNVVHADASRCLSMQSRCMSMHQQACMCMMKHHHACLLKHQHHRTFVLAPVYTRLVWTHKMMTDGIARSR